MRLTDVILGHPRDLEHARTVTGATVQGLRLAGYHVDIVPAALFDGFLINARLIVANDVSGAASAYDLVSPECSFRFSYDARRRCVIGVVEGECSLAAVAEYYERLARIMTDHDCSRALSDGRRANLTLHSDAILCMAEQYARMGLPTDWKRATVLSATPDQTGLWESQMLARGHTSRVFSAADAALAWLSRPTSSEWT